MNSKKDMQNHTKETIKPIPFAGAIFDLDGVVTSTESLHYLAFQKMFKQDAGIDYTENDYHLYNAGIPRIESVQGVLKAKGKIVTDEEIERLAELKQNYYLELIEIKGIKKFESTIQLIDVLKKRGIKVAVASASKNTPLILEKIGMSDAFDVIIAGNKVIINGHKRIAEMKGKPEPDIFLIACEKLGISPKDVIGFEDAVSGIDALKTAGIVSVGINRSTDEKGKQLLKESGADIVVDDLSEVTLNQLGEVFERKKHSTQNH